MTLVFLGIVGCHVIGALANGGMDLHSTGEFDKFFEWFKKTVKGA